MARKGPGESRSIAPSGMANSTGFHVEFCHLHGTGGLKCFPQIPWSRLWGGTTSLEGPHLPPENLEVQIATSGAFSSVPPNQVTSISSFPTWRGPQRLQQASPSICSAPVV